MNLQDAMELNLPHLTSEALAKVKVRYSEGKPVAIVIAVGDALPDVVLDYELLIEAGYIRERKAEREKAEYRELLRENGLKVANWDAVLRSGKVVRQHEDNLTRLSRRKREIKKEKAELNKAIKKAKKQLKEHGDGTHVEWENAVKAEMAEAMEKLAQLQAQ